MKNTIFLILLILLLLAVVIFTLQNTTGIEINIFMWQIRSSLALVLFSTFTAGFLVGLLVLAPRALRSAPKREKSFQQAPLKPNETKNPVS